MTWQNRPTTEWLTDPLDLDLDLDLELLEANGRGLFAEAATAHHETVLADQTNLGTAHAAVERDTADRQTRQMHKHGQTHEQ